MLDLLQSGGTYVLAFVAVLTVLVFVHEYGHYKIARLNGIRVEVFSIGFGPAIWSRLDKSGTRWKISIVPLGGYVKFFGDMDPTSGRDAKLTDSLNEEERKVCFHHKSVAQRAAVVFAGPAANFLYAFVVLTLIYVAWGKDLTPPIVARIAPDSPALAQGFQVGDKVLAIDGRKVSRFEDIADEVLMNPKQQLTFKVLRHGHTLNLTAVPAEDEFTDNSGSVHKIGYLGLLPSYAAVVSKVLPGSPAEKAGFQVGDEIVAIDKVAIRDFQQVRDIVLGSNGRTLNFVVARHDKDVTLQATPRVREITQADGSVAKFYMIGIHRATPPPVRLGPLSAMQAAVGDSYLMISRTLDYLGQVIVGRRGTEELGGPIRIAQVSGEAAQLGMKELIMLSVLLSLNLGFVNLLPIPMLDGGHLLFYALEAVRGRPLTERMQEHALRFGFLVVLSLMLFVTWNDLVNLRVFQHIVSWFS